MSVRQIVEADLAFLRTASDLKGQAFRTDDPRDYARIPDRTLYSLASWVTTGRPTGGFLAAVLAGDLSGAVARGDMENLGALPAIVCWLSNNAPAACWGDEVKVDEWARFPQGARESLLGYTARWKRFVSESE